MECLMVCSSRSNLLDILGSGVSGGPRHDVGDGGQ